MSAQPYKISALDSILFNHTAVPGFNKELSRECSGLFHEKLNQYRIAKHKQALKWNDSVWLAALNHALYIDANEHFSHVQRSNGQLFSGITPDRRFYYVIGKSDKIVASGENIFIYANK